MSVIAGIRLRRTGAASSFDKSRAPLPLAMMSSSFASHFYCLSRLNIFKTCLDKRFRSSASLEARRASRSFVSSGLRCCSRLRWGASPWYIAFSTMVLARASPSRLRLSANAASRRSWYACTSSTPSKLMNVKLMPLAFLNLESSLRFLWVHFSSRLSLLPQLWHFKCRPSGPSGLERFCRYVPRKLDLASVLDVDRVLDEGLLPSRLSDLL